jgi:O-antigen ligase
MALVLALQGLWQYFFTDAGPLSSRIRGLFSHYMTFSGVLLIAFSLSLARLSARGEARKPWRWLATLAIGTTLVLTLTRSAWLAALVVLVLSMWLLLGHRALAGLALLGLVVALLLPLATPIWRARLASVVDLRDPSNYDRLCMAEAATYMISERPLFGLGPGMVSQLYPLYRHPTAPRYNVPHLHNTYLHLAAERGLLSLAAYLWLIWVSARGAYRGYAGAGVVDDGTRDLHLGVLLALAGFHVAGLFEANWDDTEVQRLLLFLLAVPWCLETRSRAEKQERFAR